MKYYPVFLDLRGRFCLVAGGGKIAERKIKTLLASGAKVTCAAAEFSPQIIRLAQKKKITIRKKRLAGPRDLKGLFKEAFLVIAATSSSQVNAAIFKACRHRNILVNSVDDAVHCDFIAPSFAVRGPLTIAVSTGGTSPFLARDIRRRIERLYGPEYAAFLRFMARKRGRIYAAVKAPAIREKIFKKLTETKFIKMFKNARTAGIEKKFLSVMKKHLNRS